MTLAPISVARLHEMASRLEQQASLIRCGGFNPKAEAEGGALADDAFAIRDALRELADLRAQVASFKESKVDDG